MADTRKNIELAVTAKDLGTKKLTELVKVFDALAEAQKEAGKASDGASRSLDDLRLDLEALQKLSAELTGRASLVELFRNSSAEVARYEQRIAELRTKLAALAKDQADSGKLTKQQAEDQKKYTKELGSSEKRLASLRTTLKGQSEALEQANLASEAQQQSLLDLSARVADLTNSTERQIIVERRLAAEQKRQAAVAREAAAQQAEAQKQLEEDRKAAAAAEAARLKELAALRERDTQRRRQALKEEQALQSGFGAFSRAAPGAPARARQEEAAAVARRAEAQRKLAAAQIQQRDADLRALDAAKRMTEVNRRADETLRRLAATKNTAANASGRLATDSRKAGTALDFLTERGRKSLSVYQRLRGQLLSIVGAYVGIFAAVNQGQRALQVYNDRLGLQQRLLVANNNSTTGAANDFAFLRQEADRLGFSLTQLGGNYSKLAVSGRAAGLETAETREIFSSFSEVARVMNSSTEEVDGVFRALDQILSKGKVQAEELRGQLGDRLTGAYTTFAKAIGVTTEELDKLLERGEVSSTQLLAFAREYRKQVAGQLPNATKTLQAQIGRLNTALDDLRMVVAESGLVDAVGDVVRELTKFAQSDEGAAAARELGETIRFLGEGVVFLLKNLNAIIPVLKVFVGLFVAKGINDLLLGAGAAAVNFGKALRKLTLLLGGAGLAGTVTKAVVGLAALKAALIATGVYLVAKGVIEYQEYRKALDGARKGTDAMREAVDALKNARGADEATKARERIELLGKEALARLSVAEAALAQAKAEEEQAKTNTRIAALWGPLGVNLTGTLATQSQQSARVRTMEVEIARLRGDIAQAGQQVVGDARAAAASAFRAAAGLLGFGNKPKTKAAVAGGTETDKEAEAAEKKRLETLKRLREQADREAVEELKANLQRLQEQEETALAARIALINIETDAKIAAAREAAAEARTLGDEQLARTIEQNIQQFESNRKAQIENERRTATSKTLLDEVAKREAEINRLIEDRGLKLDEIERNRAAGRLTDLDAQNKSREVELDYQGQILQRTAALRAYIMQAKQDGSLSLDQAMALDEALRKLDEIPGKVESVSPAVTKLRELQEQLAGGLTDVFATLGTAIAGAIQGTNSWGDAINATWDAFRNFIADFLVGIGKAIIQVYLLKAIQSAFGATSILGQAASLMSGGVLHSGGIAGASGPKRSVSPAVFAGAVRYHSGGVVGLRPNEVPAILERGEEVVTANDPRHRNNGGGSGQQINIINAIESSSVVQEGLKNSSTVRSLVNIVRANKAAFKTALG